MRARPSGGGAKPRAVYWFVFRWAGADHNCRRGTARNRIAAEKSENLAPVASRATKRIRGFPYPLHRPFPQAFLVAPGPPQPVDPADKRTVYSLEYRSNRPGRY